MDSGGITLLAHQCGHQLGRSAELSVQSFSWGLITQAGMSKLLAT